MCFLIWSKNVSIWTWYW